MIYDTPEEKAEAKRLGRRAYRCAQLCAEIAQIDPLPSKLGLETNALTDILELLQKRVDSGRMRLSVCMRLMETVFDLQEENIAARRAQLKRHGEN